MVVNFIHKWRDLDELPITPVHRERLKWFLDYEGMIVPFRLFGTVTNPWLTSRPKGIYKPEGWEFSLSIKETLKSPYGDIPIQTLSNGEWVYRYHREDGENKDTNRGLINCMEQGIPVGVLIQVQGKPDVRYFVAGLGLITQFNDPWFDLVSWQALSVSEMTEPLVAEPGVVYDEGHRQGNLPGFIEEVGEEKYIQQLTRPNQSMFRVMILSSYERTCAVTGSEVVPALEAAHIRPYRYEKIDRVQNGLLLRADVHRLFDRGYIGVDTSHMETVVSTKLIGSEYEQFERQPLIIPSNQEYQPSAQYLDEHRKQWQLT